MKTLRSMLNLGTNALGTHRATLSVLSKNIANASTPGYSRERLSIESMSFGLGAQVTGLTSLRDTTYQKALLGASQELGFGQGKASVLEIAEPFVNDLDGAGMGPALDALFGALQSAGANPADLNERGAVLDRARELADQIRNSATGLESARRSAEKSAAATVTEVNELAAQLARLNGQIRDIQGSGDPALELVDQRDELLAALGELVDVEVTTPQDHVGDVVGDLNRRRGQIQNQESSGSTVIVRAQVPLKEMFGYISHLRSMTKGRASFTMQFHHYDPVPRNIADEIMTKSA